MALLMRAMSAMGPVSNEVPTAGQSAKVPKCQKVCHSGSYEPVSMMAGQPPTHANGQFAHPTFTLKNVRATMTVAIWWILRGRY